MARSLYHHVWVRSVIWHVMSLIALELVIPRYLRKPNNNRSNCLTQLIARRTLTWYYLKEPVQNAYSFNICINVFCYRVMHQAIPVVLVRTSCEFLQGGKCEQAYRVNTKVITLLALGSFSVKRMKWIYVLLVKRKLFIGCLIIRELS